MNKYENVNIINYGCLESKRVSRSAHASELFAIVHGIDILSTSQRFLNGMLDRFIQLNFYTNSQNLSDCLVQYQPDDGKAHSHGTTNASPVVRPLQNNSGILNSYIPEPTNAFTKAKSTPALKILLMEDLLSLTPNAWVERSVLEWEKSSYQPMVTVCAIF